MTDQEKQEKFIRYKMKSSMIKNGWMALYPVLLFIMLGVFFSPWFYLGVLVSLYPLWILNDDLKRLRKELSKLKQNSTKEDIAEE